MTRFNLLVFFLVLLTGGLRADRPVIQHEAPPSVVAGQELRLVARVSSPSPLESVSIHVTRPGDATPRTLPMQPAGAGIHTVTLDPVLFRGVESFRYYIDAHTTDGAWSESNWFTVRVVGSGEEDPDRSGWGRPAFVGLGAAAVVGGAILLSDSGSGGGGGGGDPPVNGDPADTLIIRTAGENVNSPSPGLPSVTIVGVADELAGRRIRRVRVRLDFDPVDGGEKTYDVSYNGRVILSGTASDAPRSNQVDAVGSPDPNVVIRVLTAEPVDGTATYRWNATVTFFLEP